MSDERAPIVRARGLVKQYEDGRITALDHLDLEIEPGEFVAICGPSGCGKSTLLHMLSGIDTPDRGELTVDGHDLRQLRAGDLDAFRSNAIGLVFQLHNLLPSLTASENVQAALLAAGRPGRARARRAGELLDMVGLAERAGNLPSTLSGGERQRVAIARALANEPRILLADEPTGALDSRTGERIVDLMLRLRATLSQTLVLVTHDAHLAQRAERVFEMLDGRIVATTVTTDGAPRATMIDVAASSTTT